MQTTFLLLIWGKLKPIPLNVKEVLLRSSIARPFWARHLSFFFCLLTGVSWWLGWSNEQSDHIFNRGREPAGTFRHSTQKWANQHRQAPGQGGGEYQKMGTGRLQQVFPKRLREHSIPNYLKFSEWSMPNTVSRRVVFFHSFSRLVDTAGERLGFRGGNTAFSSHSSRLWAALSWLDGSQPQTGNQHVSNWFLLLCIRAL